MGMIVARHVVFGMQNKANERFELDLIESVAAAEEEFGIFDPEGNDGAGHPLEAIADLTGIFPDNHPDIPRWRKWFRYLRTVNCVSDPDLTLHDKLRQIIYDNIKPDGPQLPMRFNWLRQDDPQKQDVTYRDAVPLSPMEAAATYRIVTITSIAAGAARQQARAKARSRRAARRGG